MGDYIGHWPHARPVTAELWTDMNLARVLHWRSAAEAQAGFRYRLATFPTSARLP